jgi:hypothetical protein
MTSVGIMASSVGNDVLLENFTSVADWSAGITSVVGGRSDNAGSIAGAGSATWGPLPVADQSFYATLGFAYKVSNVGAAVRPICALRDTAAAVFVTLRTAVDGSLGLVGGTSTPLYASSAPGLIVGSTWAYLEVQLFASNVGGYCTLRINGATVASVSGIDTLAITSPASPIAVLALLGPGSGQNAQWDDLYLSMGPSATLKGDVTIP